MYFKSLRRTPFLESSAFLRLFLYSLYHNPCYFFGRQTADRFNVYQINKTQTFFETFGNNAPLRYGHRVPKYEKRRMNMAKIADMGEKIAKTVTEGYQKIEDGVVGGYKKIESGVVEGFGKVSDRFVETLFAKEGETVEDAKNRRSGEKKN